jgi:hypothetical protein
MAIQAMKQRTYCHLPDFTVAKKMPRSTDSAFVGQTGQPPIPEPGQQKTADASRRRSGASRACHALWPACQPQMPARHKQ